MPGLDLTLLATTNPVLRKPGVDLERVRFADLDYTNRFKALIGATKGQGKPLACDPFNDLLNGHHSVASVQRVVAA